MEGDHLVGCFHGRPSSPQRRESKTGEMHPPRERLRSRRSAAPDRRGENASEHDL